MGVRCLSKVVRISGHGLESGLAHVIHSPSNPDMTTSQQTMFCDDDLMNKIGKKRGFPNLVFFRRFTQNNFKTFKDKLKGAH